MKGGDSGVVGVESDRGWAGKMLTKVGGGCYSCKHSPTQDLTHYLVFVPHFYQLRMPHFSHPTLNRKGFLVLSS